jgi:alkylation response protein AidB-like acyl-CoA dehydrogenase
VSHGTAQTSRAVDEMLPLVRERVGDIERNRRLPDDVVDALRATGINRLFLPAAMGGIEAPTTEVVDIVQRIASVDGSTAWCAVIGSGSNVFSGYLPAPGARKVFADPDQGSATMFAPAGRVVERDGQRRLTGRWPFTSNCLHSAWIGVGALVEGRDGIDPVPCVVFVPTSDFTIEDTWDAAGLRGTGSHHVSAHDVPIDVDRTCRFSDPSWAPGLVWRLPIYSRLLPSLTAVPLGIARGALDDIARQVREGRDARRGQLGDDVISMGEFAIADAQLRAARAGLRDALTEAHDCALLGEPVDRQLQARIALACLHACDVSVEVTSVAHALGGGAAAYHGSALLRALNDVHAARQHMLFAHKHRSELGKVLAGLDVAYPPFIA